MKKILCFILPVLFILLAFSGCKDTPDNGDADVSDSAPTVISNPAGFINQPDNALEEKVDGLLLCYLDYYVRTDAYLGAVSTAVTPVLIDSPSEFNQFFYTYTYTKEDGSTAFRAQELYDEMCASELGKAVYTGEEFYKTWNLLILSVRESSKETTHTIDSVTYNNETETVTVNGLRHIASADDGGTVRQIVLRIPNNRYLGVHPSFKDAASVQQSTQGISEVPTLEPSAPTIAEETESAAE